MTSHTAKLPYAGGTRYPQLFCNSVHTDNTTIKNLKNTDFVFGNYGWKYYINDLDNDHLYQTTNNIRAGSYEQLK